MTSLQAEAMMPPKKSRAARGANQNDVGAEAENENTENGQEEERAKTVADSEHDEVPKKEKKFMWDDEVVEGKRKRLMPAAEQNLHDWLSEHLEERDETRIATQDLYNCYLEACISVANFGVDQFVFSKIMKQRFPKGFGIKPNSVYHGIIKEKKMRKKVVKVQADSLKLKMKDIIEKAINDSGNPGKGVRFHTLKQYIALRYPALRIDLRPSVLKNALQKGMRFGHVVCVRGIGACGYYRIPGGEEEEEDDKEKEKKKLKKEKTAEDEEKKEGEGEEDKKEKEEDAEGDEKEKAAEDKSEKKEEEPPRKTRGRKKTAAVNGKTATKKKKPGVKGKKTPAPRKIYRSFIVHSDPQRVEDCFPLALTFMSEPKEASVNKIKKYVEHHYKDVNVEARLKKAIVSGLEKGFWEQVTGSGPGAGTFRLEITEFDPTDDDDMIGMIINAIMACTEPKQCSANLLKKYIMEYHPNFKLSERPSLFKKALQRAVNKNVLRQLSGIGATGSFQLAIVFQPSPVILAGQDSEGDYDSEDEESSVPEVLTEVDVSDFMDKYVPRPTKRRGKGRTGAAGIERLNVEDSRVRVVGRPTLEGQRGTSRARGRRPAGRGRGQAKQAPAKKPAARDSGRGRGRGASRRSYREESASEGEASESEAEVKSTPKPRGRKRAKPTPVKTEDSESEAESAPSPAPAKTPRGAKRSRGQSSRPKRR